MRENEAEAHRRETCRESSYKILLHAFTCIEVPLYEEKREAVNVAIIAHEERGWHARHVREAHYCSVLCLLLSLQMQ